VFSVFFIGLRSPTRISPSPPGKVWRNTAASRFPDPEGFRGIEAVKLAGKRFGFFTPIRLLQNSHNGEFVLLGEPKNLQDDRKSRFASACRT
jgi:hypothetical protein